MPFYLKDTVDLRYRNIAFQNAFFVSYCRKELAQRPLECPSSHPPICQKTVLLDRRLLSSRFQ